MDFNGNLISNGGLEQPSQWRRQRRGSCPAHLEPFEQNGTEPWLPTALPDESEPSTFRSRRARSLTYDTAVTHPRQNPRSYELPSDATLRRRAVSATYDVQAGDSPLATQRCNSTGSASQAISAYAPLHEGQDSTSSGSRKEWFPLDDAETCEESDAQPWAWPTTTEYRDFAADSDADSTLTRPQLRRDRSSNGVSPNDATRGTKRSDQRRNAAVLSGFSTYEDEQAERSTFAPFSGVARKTSTWTLRLRSKTLASLDSLPGDIGRRLSRAGSIASTISVKLFPPVTEERNAAFSEGLDIDAEREPPEDDYDPSDPARKLARKELLHQRLMFGSIIFALNVICIIMSVVGYSGAWVLAMILFFKSKDFFSVCIQVFCRSYNGIRRMFVKPAEQEGSWILSLIPAYSESEEQIVKTLFSLRDNGTGKHRQVMCVILDGKPRPIKSHMTKVVASFEWKYVSLKWKFGILKVDAGFVDNIPTLCIEKCPNAGKKDTLILCHDLFNYPRSNIDIRIQRLRTKLWSTILPQLTGDPDFAAFDLVFCTDADSTIHNGALALLADACLADPASIAACGFVFVEFEPGFEWSVWNLYQNFQYAFGQIVRRGAEHFIGKVTCLPGCITMIRVRPEMAGAIEKYAAPVTTYPVLKHQIQYLGTDRRLTYSMLSQGKHLHTLFVPEAGSETLAPQSVKHYLSQRRRWGSNAYFNNYWYCGGARMIWITRVFACVEVARLTMVYYRVFNTVLFLYGVAKNFSLTSLLPMLAISFLPSFWFAFCVAFLNAHLRKSWVKLICGFCINRVASPFMSITVFSLLAKNLGSQVWGMTGGTPVAAAPAVPVPVEAAMEMEAITAASETDSTVQAQYGGTDVDLEV